jgi:hypothetical protein
MANDGARAIFSRIPGASLADEGATVVVVSMPPATSGAPTGVVGLVALWFGGTFGVLPLIGAFTVLQTSIPTAVPLALWQLAIAAAIFVSLGRAIGGSARIVRVEVESSRVALVTRPLGVHVRHWLRAGDLARVTWKVQSAWHMASGRGSLLVSVQREPLGLVRVGAGWMSQRFIVDPVVAAAPLVAALEAWRDAQPGRERAGTGRGCMATLLLFGAAIVATAVHVSGVRLFHRPIEDVLSDVARPDVMAQSRGEEELEGRRDEAVAFARAAITGPAPSARLAVVAAALFEPQLLLRGLEHENPRVREDAVRALRHCDAPPPGAAAALRERLSDPDPTTREEVEQTLRWIGADR